MYAFIKYDRYIVKIYDKGEDWQFICDNGLLPEFWTTQHLFTAPKRESLFYAVDKYFSTQSLPLPSYDTIMYA